MIEAGLLGLRLVPIATGFNKKAEADIRAQKAAKAEVKVTADIRKAAAEIGMFRAREQAKDLKLRVDIDEKSIRRANDKIRYIEHTWKQSDIKKAIRVQVYVSGATLLPILSQGILSVTTAITELGKAAFALPGLLSGVVTAVGTMTTGFSGVGAALKAANDGMQKTAQSARQYAQAARQLEDAQRGVVTALKNANREIQDQKTKLAQGQLSVEQARLNVERANKALREGGFKSSLEYREALLGVKQANLDLSVAVEQSRRNLQDYYAEAGKAATETDTYKDALDNLADSVDKFRKAQFAAKGMSEQFISAMEQLAPAGQDFVLKILEMKGAWEGLKASVQTTLFRGLGDDITRLAQKQLPMLKTGMQQVAASLNANFRNLATVLGRQVNTDRFAKIFDATAKAIDAAKPGLDAFTTGLIHLSEVGARFLPRMALAFNKVMGRFEAFIDRADKDGSLERWIDSGLKLLTSLGRSIKSIGSILNSVTEAYNKATGNVGGFAATVERQLSKLAAYLSSPRGQGALISYIRKGQQFMKVVADQLPGIRDAFRVIGDAARSFAEVALPVFSFIGTELKNNAHLVGLLVKAYLGFKTVNPIVSSLRKHWVSLRGSMEQFREKQKKTIEQTNRAYQEHYKAQGLAFAAHQRVLDNKFAITQSERTWKAAMWRLQDARRVAQLAQEEVKKATAAEKKAKAAKDSPLIIPGSKGKSVDTAKEAKRAAQAVVEAKALERAALDQLDRRQADYHAAVRQRSEQAIAGQYLYGKAQRDFKIATDNAAVAQKNLREQMMKTTGEGGGFIRRLISANGLLGRMKMAIGAGRGGGLAGALGGLAASFGKVLTAVGSVGTTVGMVYVFDQLTAAQDRNRASADNLRESQEALAQTLSKGTGSATAATLEENARQLRDRANPVHPDDPGQRFDATKILEAQLGITLPEAVNLALPTEFNNREKRLAPADSKIIAAVPGLTEWKKWGEKYKQNGVDETVYGKALNGDPESIGKVEAARKAIKDTTALGPMMNMGLAANTGYAPDDLGAAQEQLPRDGSSGGLRGLSLAAGALRGVGNDSLSQSQKEYEGSKITPQGGLNTRGKRAFGPFILGANGAVLRADGSAVIEVDRYPDDVVRDWVSNAAPNGISVEKRFPAGAIITIDPENAGKYFNTPPPIGRAKGGPVWGAGTSTSDSIPAMLSNGEFVINAKSAAIIGHERLAAMNAIRGYAPGGPVKREDSIFGSSGSGADVYVSPAPMVTNPQTLPEALGLPTTRQSIFGAGGGGGGNVSRVTKPENTLPGILGESIFPAIQPPPKKEYTPGFFPLPKKPRPTPPPPPVTPTPPPPVQSPKVDSSPVTKPLPHIPSKPYYPQSFVPTTPLGTSTPSLPSPGSSVGAAITPNGNIYIPKLGGSGALGDKGTTGLSAAPNAQINPDAHILDYLIQVANAYGLRAGSGPPNTDEGNRVANELGIPNHGAPDGGQHDIHRALDIGNSEQARNGSLTAFARAWMSDPVKVAATRQLIYQDPNTGEAFGIINGRVLSSGEAANVYSKSIAGHQDHVHLALEGVPANAFLAGGQGAPFGGGGQRTPGSGNPGVPIVPGQMPTGVLPPSPGAPPAGPSIDVPPPPAGPLDDVPFDGLNLLKQIGAALLKGIFGFFGIDGSAIVDAIFGIDFGSGAGKQQDPIDEFPTPDQQLLDQMDSEIARQEAIGTPEAKDLAKKLKENKENYLKQYDDAAIARNSEELAKYYESINDPEMAARIRGSVSGGKKPAAPAAPPAPKPGGGGSFVAPPAAYSGGTPEVHNAVYRAFKEAGYPDSEWPALVQLLNHENDTWDPTRPTGGPNSDASGIFQFLSTTWGTVGMTYSEDPYTQGVAGMRYIKQRYGTPTGAWNAWQNNRDAYGRNWYSLGGLVKGYKMGGPAKKGWDSGAEEFDPWDFMEQTYGDGILMAPPGGGMPFLVDPMHNATGGYVSGPGTGTSDSIPAMLSDGEFVMRADAVKHWGVDRLQAMNKYADGGLVGYAPGGLVDTGDVNKQPWQSAFADGGKGITNALFDAGFLDGTKPVAPSMGMPSLTPQVPNTSTSNSLGFGPTPNVVNNSWAENENKFRTGMWNALDNNVNSTIEAVQDPIGTVKAMAPLIGLGGENGGIDLGLAGRTWKELGKSTVHWDEWGTDPMGALGGTFVELGGMLTGGGAKAAQMAAKSAQIRKTLAPLKMTDLNALSRRTRSEVRKSVADVITNFPQIQTGDRVLANGSRGFSEVLVNRFNIPTGYEQAYAWADPDTGILHLNGRVLTDRKKFLASVNNDIKTGWHNPLGKKGAVFETIAHELGHFFDFQNLNSMSSYVYKGLIEQMFGNYFNAKNPGLATYGFSAVDQEPVKFARWFRNAMSQYSYEPAIRMASFERPYEHMLSQMGISIGDVIPHHVYTSIQARRRPDLYGWATKSIDRYESIAEAFADVASRGSKASEGSKLVWQVIQDYLDGSGVAQLRLPDDPIFNTRGPFFNRMAPKSLAAPKPGDNLSALSVKEFDKLANARWEYPIEEGFYKESYLNRDEFKALEKYSASSSVNKSLRGLENFPADKALLDELLAVRESMSGPGGLLHFPGYPELFREVEADLSIWRGQRPLDQIIREVTARVNKNAEGIFNGVKRPPPDGISTQQVWESYFIYALGKMKKKLSVQQQNMDSIATLDSAFKHSYKTPRDLWVTRMVDDFGDGPVDYPSDLIGETLFNPGYTSTRGGVNYSPELSDEWVKNVFGDRRIMQQILVPEGTPGVWFGGPEHELLLPRNMGFTPHGFQKFNDALPHDMRSSAANRADMVARITGQPANHKYKIWGSMDFPKDPFSPPDVAATGFSELDNSLRDLFMTRDGVPEWTRLLAEPGPNTYPYGAFDIGPYANLGYASGGYVSGPGGPKSDMIPALLSNGEFVMNAKATEHWGADRLMAMNRYSEGGLVPHLPLFPPPMTPPPAPPPPPTGSSDPQAFTDLTKPLPPPTGSSDPDAFADLDKVIEESFQKGGAGPGGSQAIGALLAPKGAGSGSAGARQPKPKDPRSTLAPAPTSDSHVNPALAGGIKGAFSTVGALAGTAASIGLAATNGIAPGAGSAAGGAASQLIAAGAQMAGDVAVGAANILSSLLVGTVTPAETGQGYGAPLLPQQPQGGGINNFQSIHNGNVVTNNLSEYNRLKDRKDAQKAAPFFNRVNS